MTSHRIQDPLIGTVLNGKYRIEALVAKGGMGVVYRGVQLSVPLDVAIKVLLPAVDHGADALGSRIKRFEREAVATSRLRHPNCVRLFDYGRTDSGLVYLVMELLRGPTLKQVLRASGKLPAARTAKILGQIAKALAEAHMLGIVHRDLKPDNVFLLSFEGETDFVKLVDFGIARMIADDTDQSLTQAGHVAGTVSYVSPEQANDKPVTGASDLYALGVLAFELLTGAPPFSAQTPVAVLYKHIHEPPPPLDLPDVPPKVSKAWNTLVQRLLAKEPEARPAHAANVVAALQHLEVESRHTVGKTEPMEDEIDRILNGNPRLAAGIPTQIVSKWTETEATYLVVRPPTESIGTMVLHNNEERRSAMPLGWTFAAGATVLVLLGALVAVFWGASPEPVPAAMETSPPNPPLRPPEVPSMDLPIAEETSMISTVSPSRIVHDAAPPAVSANSDTVPAPSSEADTQPAVEDSPQEPEPAAAAVRPKVAKPIRKSSKTPVNSPPVADPGPPMKPNPFDFEIRTSPNTKDKRSEP
ncbi:MAG: protein kinase [Myxococcales bacterium]|nr:protein kinase [Myxococcales bacterium]